MNRIKIVLLTLLACLCACNENDKPQFTIIEGYDNPMKENGEGIEYKDFYVTKLKAPYEKDISSIQKIDFLNDHIIVQTSKGVYCFDKEGNYLRQYGTKGHGPGEYVQIGGIIVDHSKNTISIYDDYSVSMLQFAFDGKYMTTKRLRTEALSYMFSADYYDENKLFVNYFLYNYLTTAFATCDTETWERSNVKSYGMKSDNVAVRSGMHAYDIHDGTVEYVLPFKNEVYCYNMQDSFPLYQVQTKKEIIKADELAKMDYFPNINFNYFQNENVFLGFDDIFEMDSYLLLNSVCNSYFLVNKETMVGQRYSNFNYECNPLKYLPLLHICAKSNGYLVGIVDSDELEGMEFENAKSDKFLNVLKQCAEHVEDEEVYLLYYKI